MENLSILFFFSIITNLQLIILLERVSSESVDSLEQGIILKPPYQQQEIKLKALYNWAKQPERYHFF